MTLHHVEQQAQHTTKLFWPLCETDVFVHVSVPMVNPVVRSVRLNNSKNTNIQVFAQSDSL